jgi:hypothetical protein
MFNSKGTSGTTNYYPFTFNKKTKERKVLYEGAVPLHKIVSHLYEIFYDYIQTPNSNTDYYLSAIQSNPRGEPHTPNILKLDSRKTRKARLKFAKEKVNDIIECFTEIFSQFVNEDGGHKIKYRKDTSLNQLKEAFNLFNSEIVVQLQNL